MKQVTAVSIVGCRFLAPESPKGNQHCPRKNGYFAHPDSSVCHLFYNCIDGEYTEVPCTPGLHFDEYQGTCVWPESSGRTGCSKIESKCRKTRSKTSLADLTGIYSLLPLMIHQSHVNERCAVLTIDPGLRSDDSKLKSRPNIDHIYFGFCIFLQTLETNTGKTLKIVPGNFLQWNFKFVVHKS